jgi:hypothetical protein
MQSQVFIINYQLTHYQLNLVFQNIPDKIMILRE